MGMDVYGNEPKDPEGSYFRRNVWGWHPLACYVEDVMPEIACHCTHWHTNDGDGLDAKWAVKLADALDARLADGTAATYVAIRDAQLKSMPDEPCDLCDGTGIRDFSRHPSYDKKRGTETCNKCEGAGQVRPSATWYELTVEDIREFARFVRASGGFSIY